MHYIYDTHGHLIAEANAATGATTREYVWLPSNDNTNDTIADSILPLHGGGGASAAEGVAPDLPLAVIEGASTYYVHTDHLGRPTRMTDAARATVWQASWKPWGEIENISGTILNNLRFPGQYFQIETNLAYNHHRHYDPVTGRYTQPDPLGFVDGPSIYAYAGNSPFMNTDREGRILNVVIGAGIGAGVNAAVQYWKTGCINLKQVAWATLAGAAGGGVGNIGTELTAAARLTGAAATANNLVINGLGNGLIGGSIAAASGGDQNSGACWGALGGGGGTIIGAGVRGAGVSGGAASALEGIGGGFVGEGGAIASGGSGSGCGCGNGSMFTW